ncbi:MULTISPECIES: LacI family DNA-binding transcriptional regulator [Actinosynnema]|uniref:LacI family DNA-binding transcriptional regulator n=1 Tax=Actinosynnema TaxID=40566 RepID=UPI0020A59F71|nr:LacI family DNA-binding transcriptional regulator [Actinosynnema pretiosum]MCP2099149.1 transcriptional regulator, LacI family [Actinosynnema pretiosum]
MAATLKDVATLAGVSVKTVSNVVNGHSFVKPENRRRVEQALAATGYRPNLGARNLRRGRTGSVALVVPELRIPYFGELAGQVITAAREHDWNVLIEQTQGTREGERAALAALGPHLVDGALVSPEALTAADFGEPAVPVVLLGEHSVRADLDRVGIDNVEAARAAVAHLVAVGRTRIAAIGAHPTRGTAAQRLTGYREALAAAGLPARDELVARVRNYHRGDGARAMAALLALPRPPDAVFCFNDLLATGALRAAAERGARVPQDVAVVGFDNTEESAYSLPSLTTVAPDKAAIAREAVDLLHRRAAGEAGGPREVGVPFALRVRESSGDGRPAHAR